MVLHNPVQAPAPDAPLAAFLAGLPLPHGFKLPDSTQTHYLGRMKSWGFDPTLTSDGAGFYASQIGVRVLRLDRLPKPACDVTIAFGTDGFNLQRNLTYEEALQIGYALIAAALDASKFNEAEAAATEQLGQVAEGTPA